MKWGNNADKQTNNNDNSVNDNNNNSNNNAPPSKQSIPFIIQKIGRGKKNEIEEISRMCIDVFFNEQKEQEEDASKTTNNGETKKQTPPWKALQLAYLRNFQEGDILARNAFKKDQLVDLIVARRVYPVEDKDVTNVNINGNKAEIIEDESQIYNLDENGSGQKYVMGEIIGYSEVSEKNFGLGGKFASADSNSNDDPKPKPNKKGRSGEKPRPYLGNLSVTEYARRSGVGSRLLDASEECVRDWNVPDHTEIVLQVEEDNPTAIQFYKRRGWEFVFADPTCRRYDTSGFFLKESRITKYAMIKRLDSGVNDGRNGDGGSDGDDSESFMQKIKNSFFVQ